MTADEILSTPIDRPSALLGRTAEEIAATFRRLAAQWHPDRNGDPRAAEVTKHLTALKAAARPFKAPTREFSTSDGRLFRMRHLSAAPTEIGEVIVGRGTLAYRFDASNSDIGRAEADAIAGLAFRDDRMRREMARFLPSLRSALDLDDGGFLIVLAKTPDQMLLSDLLRHMGRVPPEHVAWIVSGLENVACYLAASKLCHGAIGPQTLLVSPQHHSVALAGGFGFTVSEGGTLLALPSRTADAIPAAALPGASASARTDLELVRLTGRECLGDPAGGRMLADPAVPAAISRWLATPPAGNAFDDYRSWERALDEAFGPRRFIELGTTPTDVYGPA